MPKQTVEEIAKTLLARGHDEHDGIDPEEERGFLLGCETGINWQKEQGIDWIEAENGNLPAVGEYVLLLLEGETFLKGKIMFDSKGSLIWVAFFADGEYPCQLRTVTHYAYVNLPKTD